MRIGVRAKTEMRFKFRGVVQHGATIGLLTEDSEGDFLQYSLRPTNRLPLRGPNEPLQPELIG